MADTDTKDWMRDASDDLAVKNGCRFDMESAMYTFEWIESYCTLYEGDHAGELIVLRDWAKEATMRLFGWVRWSEKYDRWIRRFKAASIWVPKKNKKSPTLAAWGTYLLCGDGEKGQKVFSCAKDGIQARISHQHAMEMVRSSPVLMDECKVHETTGAISHLPSRSTYRIVAGDNINSQEGLNGTVLIDETHVVDKRLISVLKRAGISRAEPFFIEVSTAGKDPEAYGKQRRDYCNRISIGEEEDDRTLFMEYAAPEDLTDEELEKDPVKYGKMANPAWGHTVEEEEYLSDYNESKVSISELADFKTYRLDLWQNTTSPWLRSGDWNKCFEDFTEDHLAHMPCWLGLDLSRTRDMTSVVLVFKDPDNFGTYYQLPFFWMPENEAKRNNHKAPFLQWHADGDLEFCSEDTISTQEMLPIVDELFEDFDIQAIIYDPMYAEDFSLLLSEKHYVERILFQQTIKQYAAPTADYERLIIEGKLKHNGHPVLTWQARHVHVKPDVNSNKRPVKPKPGDIKKIDGIVAGVMSLGMAYSDVEEVSIYEDAGNLTL